MKMVCPHCGLGGTADAGLYQKKVRCPECQKVFRVNEEVVVDFPSAVPGEREQSLEAHGSSHTENLAAEKTQTSPEAESDKTQNLDAAGHEQCAVCGFRLSRDFIRVIDDRPICLACAA